MPPIYDPEAVKPMEQELVSVGITALSTPEDVDQAVAQDGAVLIVINSVCGCAAGGARPGVTQALQHAKIPTHLYTAFAGVTTEAVGRVREHMAEIPPCSPCIALFKEGKPVHVLERRHIEQMDANAIATNLTQVFDQVCDREGPSISKEEYDKLQSVKMCGSDVPLYQM
ncbi:MAG: BrxA/BrxB family bacilliredoxin [Candidatus Hinthialibacter antarcticus]|nr:BrxA/BrxB family bacilliredoxin [Candidatus Hinthialibacter antarcticus]